MAKQPIAIGDTVMRKGVDGARVVVGFDLDGNVRLVPLRFVEVDAQRGWTHPGPKDTP